MAIGLFAAILVACGGDDRPAPATSPGDGTPEGDVMVFAASSLTDAFREAETTFNRANPDVKVTFNFAASSALATQIDEGAPADVFASADTNQMNVVADAGNAANPVLFATNVPTVVVPKSGSPVAGFADLAKAGVKLVLAAPEVPVGKYAREILATASKMPGGVRADFSERVLANLQSNEANVKAVLTKVQTGEADAGIVYTTDAATATNDVTLVEIPTAYNVVARYPIAVVKGTKNEAAARAWIDFILGADGQAVLAKHGFGKKPAT